MYAKLMLLVSLVFSVSAFAGELKPCGEHEGDRPELNWRTLADVALNSKLQNVKGILCTGFTQSDNEFVEVIYRDDSGSRKVFLLKDLILSQQVLLNSEDLDVGIIKDGNIMTLKIDQLSTNTEETNYKINLNFLRNLSKLSRGRDHRKLALDGHLEKKHSEIHLTYGKEKAHFKKLKIHISLGLKIHKVELFRDARKMAEIDTKKLPQIDGL